MRKGPVVWPEHESDVGPDVSHRLCCDALRIGIYIEVHGFKFQEPFLNAKVFAKCDGVFCDFLAVAIHFSPIGVIAQ